MLGLRVWARWGRRAHRGRPDGDRAGTKPSGRCARAIAARRPFLDFALQPRQRRRLAQQFRVSGEPMFNQACRFVGYRGIGVELTPGNPWPCLMGTGTRR
jgi:hypothetical protein